jgi:hypothetical protein
MKIISNRVNSKNLWAILFFDQHNYKINEDPKNAGPLAIIHLIFFILLTFERTSFLWGRGKIKYTFSANANVFPFRFCLTHPPCLLVTR